jgi:type II secretion system protein H
MRRTGGAAPREAGDGRSLRTGFSLIEVLAVLVIFALLAGVVLPNFGIRGARILDEESRRLASTLEFARQRAVMTGKPHRVVVDLDRRVYQIEAFGAPPDVEIAEAELAETAPPPSEEDFNEPAMSPPFREDLDYYPLLGTPGDIQRIDDEVAIEGVDYSAGTATEGVFQVVFERDGTADWASILLGNQTGRKVALHVDYLADSVGIERVAQ